MSNCGKKIKLLGDLPRLTHVQRTEMHSPIPSGNVSEMALGWKTCQNRVFFFKEEEKKLPCNNWTRPGLKFFKRVKRWMNYSLGLPEKTKTLRLLKKVNI